MEKRYRQLVMEMKDSGYSGKCTVIALSILYDLPFHNAMHLMDKLRRISTGKGPRRHGGYSWTNWRDANRKLAEERGMVTVEVPLERVRRLAKTTKTFTVDVAHRLHIRNGYIETRGHVSAVRNYVVEDWADNRRKRITRVVKVVDNNA